MTIICPECGTPYRLPAGMVPTQRSAAKCKKCGTRMIISPENQGETDVLAEYPATDGETYRVDESIKSAPNSSINENDEVSDAQDREDLLTENANAREEILSILPALKDLSVERFKFSDIFTQDRKGNIRHRKNKFKSRILSVVAPLLTEKILLENEQVLNIARGSGYYPEEIPYANGIFTLPTNYFAIVCTNFRLILINIDPRVTKVTRHIYQVFYEEIIRLGRGVFLTSLIIHTRNDKSWNFTSVGMSLSKEIIDLIFKIKKTGPSGVFDGTPGWQLCPVCYKTISANPSACPSCESKFKNPSVACKRSLMLPGLGSIYLGYIPLGVIELCIYFSLWVFLATLAYLKLPGIIPIWILMLIIVHGTAGFSSLKLGQKGVVVEPVKIREDIPDESVPELDASSSDTSDI